MKSQVLLHKASVSDFSVLQPICLETYALYFGDYWLENGLEWYLKKEFGDEKLKSDLKDRNVDYYIIQLNNSSVGFIKVNNEILNQSFTDAAELEKMYVLSNYRGLGIGKKALGKVLGITRGREKKILFLDVLDTNKNAINFYKSLGFELHSKIRLKLPYFKDEFRGLNRMFIQLDKNT